MANEFLTELLGSSNAEAAETACQQAFVKQASAEGIDLTKVAEDEVQYLYEQVFKPAWANELQKQAAAQVTVDSVIEKAAADGASDAVLERLALAKLSGEAMFEGWRESWEKFAQEAAAEGAEAPPPEAGASEGEAAAQEAPPPAEVAKEIVESAAEQAVEMVAEQAPDAPPEQVAQQAAEQVPAIVEQKTAELVEYFEKNASDKEAAVAYLSEVIDCINGEGTEKTAKDDGKKTYPISRALTSHKTGPMITGALGAGAGALLGKGAKGRALGALIGGAGVGGAHALGAQVARRISARAMLGRIRKGKGLVGKEKQLQEKKAAAVDMLKEAINWRSVGTHAGAAAGGAATALGVKKLLAMRKAKKEKSKQAAEILKAAMLGG